MRQAKKTSTPASNQASNSPSLWWLWLLVAIPPLVAVATTVLAPEPHGHWTEHLAGAALKSAQLALLIALITRLGWRNLSWWLLASFGILAVGIGFQAVGDHEVAQSIWGTTDDPGFGIGYEAGHEKAAQGDLLVVVGGLSFAVIAGLSRRVSPTMAVLASVLVFIPPPFFWPGVGVLVLVIYWLASRSGPAEADAGQRTRSERLGAAD